MQLSSRKLVDRSFTGLGITSILLLTIALIVILSPIVVRGVRAFVFRGTIEHRRVLAERFGRGDYAAVMEQAAQATEARAPIYELIAAFERDLASRDFATRKKHAGPLSELKDHLRSLLGPMPNDPSPVLMRDQYGQARWDRARVKVQNVLMVETYDYSDPSVMGRKVLLPRSADFQGTSLAALSAFLDASVCASSLVRLSISCRYLFASMSIWCGRGAPLPSRPI